MPASIVNIDEELAHSMTEEEMKNAPKEAQESVESFEKYCLNQSKCREIKNIRIRWLRPLFKAIFIPIVRTRRILSCKSKNELNTSLLNNDHIVSTC